mgnify:CR=1 FL=1
MTNKRTLTDWIVATRPWSYPASTMPVALVLAYYFANGVAIDPVNAVWALVNIVIFHAAGNVWSDYFDFRYGVDNQKTVSSWPGSFSGLQFSFLSSERCVRYFSFGEQDYRFWR